MWDGWGVLNICIDIVFDCQKMHETFKDKFQDRVFSQFTVSVGGGGWNLRVTFTG